MLNSYSNGGLVAILNQLNDDTYFDFTAILVALSALTPWWKFLLMTQWL